MLQSTPFLDLSPADFEELCTLGITESDQLEFKEFVPGRKGHDAWHDGENKISEYGRNELLSEIVGIANTRGGHLIIGIKESNDRPRRAISLQPVRACQDLADRLRQQSFACIEPRLADLQVAGIPVNEDGSGLVVFRVPRSRNAPHRLIPANECYVRRGESTERLNMREIQDLTLNTLRGIEFAEKRLAELRQEFEKRGEFGVPRIETAKVGIRVSLSPLEPLALARGIVRHALSRSRREFRVHSQHESVFTAQLPVNAFNERPILRGHLLCNDNERFAFTHSAYEDGSQSATTIIIKPLTSMEASLVFDTWILGLSLSALSVAADICTAAGVPATEFAVEIQVIGTHGSVRLQLEGMDRSRSLGTNNLNLPTYSFIPERGLAQSAQLIRDDLRNSIGFEHGNTVARVD